MWGCNTNGAAEKYIQDFGEGNLSNRNHLEKLGVDGRIILKCIIRKWDGALSGLL